MCDFSPPLLLISLYKPNESSEETCHTVSRRDEHHHSASLRRFGSVSKTPLWLFLLRAPCAYVPCGFSRTCRAAIDRLRAVCRAAYRAPTCRVLLETRRLSSAYVPCGAPITCTIVPRRFCNQLVYRVGRLYTWNTQRAALANVARRSRAQIVCRVASATFGCGRIACNWCNKSFFPEPIWVTCMEPLLRTLVV